ncbi:hypothetical protein DFQ26_004653, partial [Actinomortierella ambigua]
MVSLTRPLIVALVCLVALTTAQETQEKADPKSVTQELASSPNNSPVIPADASIPPAFRAICYRCTPPCSH